VVGYQTYLTGLECKDVAIGLCVSDEGRSVHVLTHVRTTVGL